MKSAFFALAGLVACNVCVPATLAQATTQPTSQAIPAATSMFDPARHMRVDEVKAGMKGYGLSVFYGSKIEKFDVEVVSILHDFNPKRDVVLIRCKGQNLEHTGSIQGMSGSPIFLTDETGKSRMIGAFAYGFPFAKDPIAGVQPIQYMLELPTSPHSDDEVEGTSASTSKANGAARFNVAKAAFAARQFWINPAQPMVRNEMQIAPLATPISVSGLSSSQIKELMPIFGASNLTFLQAGGGAGSPDDQPVEIEPGSALCAPVLTGDVQLIATGTVTEVIGNNVWGFGHPFNGEGPIALPFGSGRINGIVAALTASYKLGAMDRVRGTLSNDQSVGIAGRLGDAPKTAPIDIELKYADGSVPPEKYHFDLAMHPMFSWQMSGVAMISALSGARELPRNHTLDYDITIEYSNGKKLHSQNRVVNGGPRTLASELAMPVQIGIDNPFQKLMPAKITASVTITPTSLSATILSARVNKQTYRPGETVGGFVFYRPFRGEDQSMPFEYTLPTEIPDGQYQMSVTDAERYTTEEVTTNAWRFGATSADSMIDALQTLGSIKHDQLYVRLIRPGDGIALGKTPLPKLPVSRRALLAATGKGDVTILNNTHVAAIPTSLIFEGSADFAITIEANPHADKPIKPAPVTTAPSSGPPQRQVSP